MGILTFKRVDISALIDAARKHHQTEIKLVGDEGVYLAVSTPPAKRPFCIYAIECNPKTCAFDDWWAMKQKTFGGSDGIERVDLDAIIQWLATTKRPTLALNISEIEFEFLEGPRATPGKPARAKTKQGAKA